MGRKLKVKRGFKLLLVVLLELVVVLLKLEGRIKKKGIWKKDLYYFFLGFWGSYVFGNIKLNYKIKWQSWF